MTQSRPNPKVDFYFDRSDGWAEEFRALRDIALSAELGEELKWGHPCYALDGANIVLMHGFKSYCALLFFKGALMKDPAGVLVQQTRNVQAGRQIRFMSREEILRQENLLKDYIREAIEIEKAGLTVARKETADFEAPEEFTERLNGDDALACAFQALTSGRQRGYLLYFAGAKQAKTRIARIDKSAPRILAGKGLDD